MITQYEADYLTVIVPCVCQDSIDSASHCLRSQIKM